MCVQPSLVIMQSAKKGMSVRSITYPSANTVRSANKTKVVLRRMNSFDCSFEDIDEKTLGREVSMEGRFRARHFLYTHSSSSSSSSSSSTSSSSQGQGQKLLRFSDERWCGPAVEQQVLISPSKSRQRSSSRLRGGHTSLERLLDWKRHSPERRSSSQSCGQRHSRSTERRNTKFSSTNERRSHFCSSVSLPPSAQMPSDTDSTSSSTSTSTQVSSEGHRRRSQFRRAWSLFSLACDKEGEREGRAKSPQQRILRPPTRYSYRRGISGLPIECTSTTLGLAY